MEGPVRSRCHARPCASPRTARRSAGLDYTRHNARQTRVFRQRKQQSRQTAAPTLIARASQRALERLRAGERPDESKTPILRRPLVRRRNRMLILWLPKEITPLRMLGPDALDMPADMRLRYRHQNRLQLTVAAVTGKPTPSLMLPHDPGARLSRRTFAITAERTAQHPVLLDRQKPHLVRSAASHCSEHSTPARRSVLFGLARHPPCTRALRTAFPASTGSSQFLMTREPGALGRPYNRYNETDPSAAGRNTTQRSNHDAPLSRGRAPRPGGGACLLIFDFNAEQDRDRSTPPSAPRERGRGTQATAGPGRVSRRPIERPASDATRTRPLAHLEG
jgi:hypothetical protein